MYDRGVPSVYLAGPLAFSPATKTWHDAVLYVAHGLLQRSLRRRHVHPGGVVQPDAMDTAA
jgi:hypothetical protein